MRWIKLRLMKARLPRRQPRTHIVRVYRETPHGVVGQVEDVRSGFVQPFRTATELWTAVCRVRPFRPAKGR